MATTGHESEAINVQGLKASLQKLKTNHIDGKAGKSTTLAGYGITDAYTKSETYTKTEVNGLVDTPHQEYVTVEATSQTTAATDVLPNSGQAADTIYRVSNWDGSANSGAGAFDVTCYSEYAWDDVSNPNKYVFLCVKTQIGEVFDISVYNNNAKYANLSAALGVDGANIPQSLRKGGMSVKFVQSSDNNYVQFRCIADEFTTDTTQWAINDAGVYVKNPEFIRVVTDNEGRIFYAVKADGSIYYGAGVPPQVVEYVDAKISEFAPENYDQVLAFLDGLLSTDTTLQMLLDAKANISDVNEALATKANADDIYTKEETNSKIAEKIDPIQRKLNKLNLAIDPDRGVLRIGNKMFKLIEYTGEADFDDDIDYTIFVDAVTTVENPEWQKAITDSEDKILYGLRHDDSVYQPDLTGYTMTVDEVTASVNSIVNNLK